MGIRVLYLTNAAQIGGGNRSLLVLWPVIRRHGVDPVACCPADGPMVGACRAAGVPVDVRPYEQPHLAAPIASLRRLRSWRSYLRDRRVDLVHANDPTNARVVIAAAASLGIPVVCHVHFPPGDGFFRWCFRMLPKPKAFAYCSDYLRKAVQPDAARACPRSVHRVVHNAIPLEQFAPRPRPPARLRVGIIANLAPIKGHEDFLAMAAELTRTGCDAEYAIVGSDIYETGYEQQLRERACQLGVADRVTFTGHVSDIPGVVQNLDVVVVASDLETFGISVLEAMAGARPVVATRVGGIPEIVVDGETGYLVEARHPEQLAARVRELAARPDLRERFGAAGRRRAEEEFSDARQAERTMALYREAGVAPEHGGRG